MTSYAIHGTKLRFQNSACKDVRKQFLGKTFQDLSGEKEILKIGPSVVELYVSEKSNEKRPRKIGLSTVSPRLHLASQKL